MTATTVISVSQIPGPGTPAADQRRADFIASIFAQVGGVNNIVRLWLPKTADASATSFTSEDPGGATLTPREAGSTQDIADWDIAGLSTRGSGYAVDLNGTDEDVQLADADDLSFGDGAVDNPLSVVSLVNPDVVTEQVIFAKWDETTGTLVREYRFEIDANGYPTLELLDESANAIIAREDATALTADTWVLLAGTYDGSGAVTGINILKDASIVDDADGDTTGTYVAMENTAAVARIGSQIGASADDQFFNGEMGFLLVCSVALSQEQVFGIKAAVNSYYALTL